VNALVSDALVKQRADVSRKFRRSFIPPIVVPQYSTLESLQLQRMCCDRILEPATAISIRKSGKDFLRQSLFSRVMALLLSNSQVDEDYFLEFVSQVVFISERLDQALYVLFVLYGSCLNEDAMSDESKYLSITIKMFRRILYTSPKLVTAFVCNLPKIPDSLYQEIDDFCAKSIHQVNGQGDFAVSGQPEEEKLDPGSEALPEIPLEQIPDEAKALVEATTEENKEDNSDVNASHVALCLALIKHIAIERISEREKCLQMLESFSISPNRELGVMSIEILSNHLYFLPPFRLYIESFAKKRFDQFAMDCEASELTDFDIRRVYLDLFFKLCLVNQTFLLPIVQAYPSLSKRGRKIVRENSSLFIGKVSDEVLEIIRDVPEGSDLLVLQMIHSLVVQEASPPTDLVRAVLSLYKNKPDPRFLIPIIPGMRKHQIIDALPGIVGLPVDHVKAALDKVINHSTTISPAELVVRVHLLAPVSKHKLLKPVS
jgi:hypothetical protein